MDDNLTLADQVRELERERDFYRHRLGEVLATMEVNFQDGRATTEALLGRGSIGNGERVLEFWRSYTARQKDMMRAVEGA